MSTAQNDAITNEEQDQAEVLTSMRVFRRFLQFTPDGGVDASLVVSRACYEMWLQTRRHSPADPKKAFHRTLCAHLAGMDGRTPFNREEEAAVLRIVRQKKVWPCFESEGMSRGYGSSGLRARGFHEKMRDTVHRLNKGLTASTNIKRSRNEISNGTVANTPLIAVGGGGGGGNGAPPTVPGMFPESSSWPPRLITVPTTSAAAATIATTNNPSIPIPTTSSPTVVARPAPVPLPIPDGTGPNLLLVLAQQILSQVGNVTSSVSDTIWSMIRMCLISDGLYSGSTMEQARAAMRHALTDTDLTRQGVLVFNVLSRNPRDRILLQTPNTIPFVGRITASDGGLDRLLFPLSEAMTALSTGLRAYRDSTGGWHHAKMRINLITNVQETFDIAMKTHREEQGRLLLIVRITCSDHHAPIPVQLPDFMLEENT